MKEARKFESALELNVEESIRADLPATKVTKTLKRKIELAEQK